MKHVFAINSHTTYLSALGTIDYLSLPSEDVIMLYMRNYNNSIIKRNYKIVDINGYDQFEWSKENASHLISIIDSMIYSEIGEPFHLYCPHLLLTSWQVIYTNRLCKEMSYIQEGGIPFKNAYKSSMTLKEKLLFFYNNHFVDHRKRTWTTFGQLWWYTSGSMRKQKLLHSFALNDIFFKYLPSINHIIKWPKVDTGIHIEKGAMVFIFDSFASVNIISRELYLSSCEIMAKKYGRRMNYLKFHPAQTEDEKQAIIDIFSKLGLSCKLLPQSVPFELVISSNEHLEIAGFSSSLLYFAYDYGHKVYCGDELLRKEESYRQYESMYGLITFSEYTKSTKK